MKVLVIVDMQNDFVKGVLGSEEAKEIVSSIVSKIEACDAKTLVVFTQDTHQEDYLATQEGKNLPVEHCIDGTKGWDIDERIVQAFNSNELIPRMKTGNTMCNTFQKDTFGCLELAETIKKYTHKVESIELVGVCTDICVVSNALLLKAHMPEVPMFVDASCCAGVTPAKHNSALDVMESCQIKIIGRR